MPLADSIRLVSRVAILSGRVPRSPSTAWERFWAGIAEGTLPEDVLWEGDSRSEATEHVARGIDHLDTSLPVVDVGCGSGWLSAALAGAFPRVLGLDASAAAVDLAARHHGEPGRIDFLTADATDPETSERLHGQLGDANAVVRGVLHVLTPAKQRALAAGLRTLVGARGRVYLVETNVPGNGLGYLRALGASGESIPAPLAQAIRTLPQPGHFGPNERARAFPEEQWRLEAEGSTALALALPADGSHLRVPAYWAVTSAR
ncbi:methyltransferase domain-containing protein [Sinomonas sp. RB5]